jgi:DNA-binding transcriptional LysR family regulator
LCAATLTTRIARVLQGARVRFGMAMELGHTEAIKQGVMAGLGIAFVSLYAVQGE